jgi:hypothetical protein
MKKIMKKIMTKVVKQETMKISDITDDDIVGLQWKDNGNKSYLLETSDGVIQIRLGDSDTKNCWTRLNKRLYLEACESFDEEFEVFVFNTREELVEWMIKK